MILKEPCLCDNCDKEELTPISIILTTEDEFDLEFLADC